MKWTPHKYQKQGVKFLLERGAAALFLDPGLGKTAIVFAALKILYKKGMASKTLVIAPLRVCHTVWPAEAEKWSDFSHLKIAVLHGKYKREILEANEHDIYVINPEGLGWLLGRWPDEVDVAAFQMLGFDTLVIDELTKFKNGMSRRFKLLKTVHHTFARRWGLTGSPVANGLMHLFGQCFILDGGRTLGRYFSRFRAKYFTPLDGNGWTWALKSGMQEEIYTLLEPLALRMSAEDYLELPQLIQTNIKIELDTKTKKLYDRVEDDLILQLETGAITVKNSMVAAGKCRQIASGAVYTTGNGAWEPIHTGKIEALQELMDELQGKPLLVACDFQHDIHHIRQHLGEDIPAIAGGCSAKESTRLIKEWNQGNIPILLAHPQSAGHGINLQEGGANHVCWFTLTWDFELYDQFIRRVWRQGSNADHVFVYHFIAKGTVDNLVAGALRSKNRRQQSLFEGLKQLQRRTK